MFYNLVHVAPVALTKAAKLYMYKLIFRCERHTRFAELKQ